MPVRWVLILPNELLHQWHFCSLSWTDDACLLWKIKTYKHFKVIEIPIYLNFLLPSFFSINVVNPSDVTLSVTIVVPGCWRRKWMEYIVQDSGLKYKTEWQLWLLIILTSSKTIADIKAIRRFRFNSQPAKSTAADLGRTCINKNPNKTYEH